MFSCDSGYSDVAGYQKSMIRHDRRQRRRYGGEEKKGKGGKKEAPEGKGGEERSDMSYRCQKGR